MGIATTALRMSLGGLMAGHGLQKLAGKFGGPGLDGAAAGFEQMGFHPGKPYATAAAVTETVGGSLLAAGALTPAATSMITGAMGVAIAKVHAPNGPWITKGGYEYNLVIIAAATAFAELGPGHLALDGILFKRRKGTLWALASLAAGLGGAMAVVQLAAKGEETPDAAAPTAAQGGDAGAAAGPGTQNDEDIPASERPTGEVPVVKV